MNDEEPEGNTAFYDLSSDRCETGGEGYGEATRTWKIICTGC